MKHIANIFIPFIDLSVDQSIIKHVFRSQNFGEVIAIDLREKKGKRNNKIITLKHNYAFIQIYLFNTVQGNNLRNNILDNKNTHIMFTHRKKIKTFIVKPYLSFNEREIRGFQIHKTTKRESFYNNEIEKKILLEEYNLLEKDIYNTIYN